MSDDGYRWGNAETAQDVGVVSSSWLYLICPCCGREEEQPFDIGDECYCGDKFIKYNSRR